MTEKLFRDNAVTAQSSGAAAYGRPTGVYPPAWSNITKLLALFMVALLIFLFTVSFARKETVRGRLRAVEAEARVFVQEAGTISGVFVRDGQMVEPGDPLVEVTVERVMSDGAVLSDEAIAALAQELDLLRDRRRAVVSAASLTVQTIDQSIGDTDRDEREAEDQLVILRQRLEQAEERLADLSGLLEEGLTAKPLVVQAEDTRLQIEAAILETDTRRRAVISERESLQIERRKAIEERQSALAEIDQRVVQIESQMRQTAAGATYRAVAPVAGEVTALQARAGEPADPARPLLLILPPDNELIAEIFLPSRAIAFVEPGQRVKLQYDAFPYQKFGIAEGEVKSVASTALFPQELNVATQTPEPLYRVEVALTTQSMRAFGQDMPLQSGMELTADIVLEDRRLVEWVMEPLLSRR